MIQQPHRSRALPISLLLFFLLFNLLTARGSYHNIDEIVMYSTVANAYNHHSLAIDELEYMQETAVIGSYSRDGHFYGKYPLGNLIFGLPLYALGEVVFKGFGFITTTLMNPLLNSIGLLMLFLYLRNQFSDRTALVSTLLLGICTDWWPASRGFGSETGAGVFLLASLIAADFGRPGWSAATFSLSFLFRPINLVAFPVLGLNYFHKGKKAVWCLGILAAAGLMTLAYNYIRFQNPLQFGYVGETFNSNPLTGFFYLLFSPGRSVFLYSPILILAIPGAVLWWRRNRAMSAILVTTVLIYPLVIGSWHSWDGGVAWAARLLIPIFPLLAVLYAPVVDQIWSKPWLAGLVGILALVGLGMALLTLRQDPMKTVFDALERGIPYEDTLLTWRNSLLNLQIKAVQDLPLGSFDMMIIKMSVW